MNEEKKKSLTEMCGTNDKKKKKKRCVCIHISFKSKPWHFKNKTRATCSPGLC